MTNSYYEVVRTESISNSGFDFVVVETPVLHGGRQHRRVIGYSPDKNLLLDGKPLVYWDTYIGFAEPKTYVYARHKASPGEFLDHLDYLLTGFEEFEGREFASWINVNGEIRKQGLSLPIKEGLKSFEQSIRFIRIAIPFGDIAIDFADPEPEKGNQRHSLRERLLTKNLERPLIGCDLSRSTVASSLMSRLHWAENQIPLEVLEFLIGQVTSSPVPA